MVMSYSKVKASWFVLRVDETHYYSGKLAVINVDSVRQRIIVSSKRRDVSQLKNYIEPYS